MRISAHLDRCIFTLLKAKLSVSHDLHQSIHWDNGQAGRKRHTLLISSVIHLCAPWWWKLHLLGNVVLGHTNGSHLIGPKHRVKHCWWDQQFVWLYWISRISPLKWVFQKICSLNHSVLMERWLQRALFSTFLNLYTDKQSITRSWFSPEVQIHSVTRSLHLMRDMIAKKEKKKRDGASTYQYTDICGRTSKYYYMVNMSLVCTVHSLNMMLHRCDKFSSTVTERESSLLVCACSSLGSEGHSATFSTVREPESLTSGQFLWQSSITS